MKQSWINKQGNHSCICFFNGWGMDENVLSGMSFGEFDVCMFYDYSSPDSFSQNEFQYNKLYVVAWSLGVSIVNIMLANNKINATGSIAVNGTPYPWHGKWGIPEDTFKKTLISWNEKNRNRFNLRMFGGKANVEAAKDRLSHRNIKNQKKELQFLYNPGHELHDDKYSWDLALVGTNDLIIPSRNQLNYWEGKTRVIQKDWPHFPFQDFSEWNELIQLIDGN